MVTDFYNYLVVFFIRPQPTAPIENKTPIQYKEHSATIFIQDVCHE